VSYNKFLAKVASDQNKPDGIFVVRPQEGEAFVASLPVRRFYGVGPKTAERMGKMGIHVGADLRARDMDFMAGQFGKLAEYLYHACRGVDRRQVRPDRIRKSVGRERTYSEDLATDGALYEALDGIIDSVWQRIENNGVTGRTVTLKVKYADFRQITRSSSADHFVVDSVEFGAIARDLLSQVIPVTLGVRLLGLTLSGLAELDSRQVSSPASGMIKEQRVFDY